MHYVAYLIILMFNVSNCEKKSKIKIKINIKVASTKGATKVDFKGTDYKIISDKEVNLFNVTEDNLKKGIKVEFGVAPDDVYLKDPTPKGNLYQQFEWQEVNRKITVKNVIIQDIINEEVLLSVHDQINNTTNKVKAPVILYENVENSLKSTWSRNGLPDDEIIYSTMVHFFNEYHFVYENKWRNDSFKMSTLPFGLHSAAHIVIQPGKTITMKLRAKKTIILLKVIYIASLTGSFVANYARLLGTYHFWAPSVINIMKAAKLNNKIITNEYMELKCYTDPVLEVFDKTNGAKIPIVYSRKVHRKRKHRGLYEDYNS